jgi:hypothetical protein
MPREFILPFHVKNALVTFFLPYLRSVIARKWNHRQRRVWTRVIFTSLIRSLIELFVSHNHPNTRESIQTEIVFFWLTSNFNFQSGSSSYIVIMKNSQNTYRRKKEALSAIQRGDTDSHKMIILRSLHKIRKNLRLLSECFFVLVFYGEKIMQTQWRYYDWT